MSAVQNHTNPAVFTLGDGLFVTVLLNKVDESLSYRCKFTIDCVFHVNFEIQA